MRQLDSKLVAGKPLDLFFYEVLKISDMEMKLYWEMLKKFSSWGLKTNLHNRKCITFEEIKRFHQYCERQQLDYDIDGIVIKADNYHLRETLGTRQRSPRWAMAWKFPPREEVTILEDIVVQVGRTGVLTPVAFEELLKKLK
jgi:DNA ligase (NAD+)